MNFWKKVAVASVALALMGSQYTRLNPVRVGDLADGTANHVSGWDGSGVAESQSRESARAFNSGNISIPNTAWTIITLDSEHWDHNDLHSTVSNTGRLTAVVDGLYLIVAQIRWASNGTGIRGFRIELNGTTEIGKVQDDPSGGGATIQDATTIYPLDAGEYVQMLGFQTSGGSLNTERIVDHAPEFMMIRLRSQ